MVSGSFLSGTNSPFIMQNGSSALRVQYEPVHPHRLLGQDRLKDPVTVDFDFTFIKKQHEMQVSCVKSHNSNLLWV